MLAATLAFTHGSPAKYEGDSYLALDLGAQMTALVGIAAALCVAAYLGWLLWRRLSAANRTPDPLVHPGEWWVILAHATAFGSSYALGATNASFLLVLAVHHEIQYLYFAYAMARRSSVYSVNGRAAARVSILSFLFWPIVGFSGAIVGGALQLSWLAPLGVGGLFCHYWLDGRIWTRKSFQS
jgi:hypothetical protein